MTTNTEVQSFQDLAEQASRAQTELGNRLEEGRASLAQLGTTRYQLNQEIIETTKQLRLAVHGLPQIFRLIARDLQRTIPAKSQGYLCAIGGLLPSIRVWRPRKGLRAVVQTFRDLARDIEKSKEAADMYKEAAANLVCNAASIANDCQKAARNMILQLEQASQSIKEMDRETDIVRDFIKSQEQAAQGHKAEYKDRMARADDHEELVDATKWIPVVNVVTFIVGLCRAPHHERRAQRAQLAISTIEASIQTHERKRATLQANMASIQEAMESLSGIEAGVSEMTCQANLQESRARQLVDQYGLLATQAGEIAQTVETLDTCVVGRMGLEERRSRQVDVLRQVTEFIQILQQYELLAEDRQMILPQLKVVVTKVEKYQELRFLDNVTMLNFW